MTIRVGVGGWTFPAWRGAFYPAGLPHKRELEYAAQHLTAIEINATYYKLQKPQSFAAWAQAAPAGFQFSLKASRFVTNRRVLAEAAPGIARFMAQGFTELGDKLGPIVWQFMPSKQFDPADFARFLDLLPEAQDGVALRHALEVRHPSFIDPAFYALAAARNLAVVYTDSAEFPSIDVATADFAYARLQRSAEARPAGYSAYGLTNVARQARVWSQHGRDAYVYFIFGAKLRNPAAAQALIKRLR